jgi:MBOAT, membrane-bound O-acyltransferase family
MNLMLILAGFLAPYLVAFAAFPLLARRTVRRWIVPVGACPLIIAAPWLIPAESQMLRFLAAISAAILAMKVIDVAVEARHQRTLGWKEYVDFVTNPFTCVRRCLAQERVPPSRENLLSLLVGLAGCAGGVALLLGLFTVDWLRWGFLVEHVSKVLALMLAISCGLSAAAAAWRMTGGVARDFMNKPFAATTPAEFWRRYNRNVQQFFWQDIFKNSGARRAPVLMMLAVFALSALLHEFIFFTAIGRVQGYQTAFFMLQGLAAVMTARVKVRGWPAAPCIAATLIFNLVSSVLFFASLHAVVPFYSQELPAWLRG